jgi:hypothetical protein
MVEVRARGHLRGRWLEKIHEADGMPLAERCEGRLERCRSGRGGGRESGWKREVVAEGGARGAPFGARGARLGGGRAPIRARRAPPGAPRSPPGARRALQGASCAPTRASHAPDGAARARFGAARAPLRAPRAPHGACRSRAPASGQKPLDVSDLQSCSPEAYQHPGSPDQEDLSGPGPRRPAAALGAALRAAQLRQSTLEARLGWSAGYLSRLLGDRSTSRPSTW